MGVLRVLGVSVRVAWGLHLGVGALGGSMLYVFMFKTAACRHPPCVGRDHLIPKSNGQDHLNDPGADQLVEASGVAGLPG